MNIEPLTPETAREYRKELTAFYYENVRSNACHGHYTPEEAKAKIEGLIRHLEDRTGIAYGAFDHRQLIGFIWAYPHPFREENRMYINEIRVREDYRRQGIGTAFLNLVEQKAKEMGIPALYLHAEAANPEALHFYEAYGYQKERIQFRKPVE